MKMQKYGFAAVVAGGLAAGILGAASPVQPVASADALPVVELPGYSTGVDHHQWVDTIHPVATVPQVDTTVRQNR
jgi:hypothetical protein